MTLKLVECVVFKMGLFPVSSARFSRRRVLSWGMALYLTTGITDELCDNDTPMTLGANMISAVAVGHYRFFLC